MVWNIFSIYWECHHPDWRTHSFFRGDEAWWNHQADTLWLCQNSYWKWPIEIVDLPIKNGGSFHRFLYVYLYHGSTLSRGSLIWGTGHPAEVSGPDKNRSWGVTPPVRRPGRSILLASHKYDSLSAVQVRGETKEVPHPSHPSAILWRSSPHSLVDWKQPMRDGCKTPNWPTRSH